MEKTDIMNKLVIIGAGNVGGYLSYNIDTFGKYEVLGFLDDDQNKHGKILYGKKVLGGLDELEILSKVEKLCVVIGISSPIAKQKMYDRIKAYNVVFPNFIAKNVWLSNQVTIGKGVILYPGVSINYETKVEDFVIMNMNCAIGHNCSIGQYSTLAPGVNLAGFTHLEAMVSVGIGVSTKQNIKVGHSSIIAGQSMLIKDVEPNTTVGGVPAKVL